MSVLSWSAREVTLPGELIGGRVRGDLVVDYLFKG